ncbi:uncharacterized protein CBL_12951 [Carabus blaptoides fortunei]
MPVKDSQENLDMDLVAEQELSRLQRQYRIIEGDRFAYSGEVNTTLTLQSKLIDIFKKEQHNLLAAVKIATAKPWKKQDADKQKYIENLLRKYEDVFESAKVHKSQLTELEVQVFKMMKEVSECRTTSLSENLMFEKTVAAKRHASLFEDRLEVMMKRFNSTNTDNIQLRKEIDHLLKERSHYNELWRHLLRCLTQGKKFLLDLIESATLTYDQREEDCRKLDMLLTKSNQDLVLHSKNLRTLQRQLDHDLKLQEFLGMKSQIRILADLEAREAKKKQQEKELNEKQIVIYQEVLTEIENFCCETDCDRIVAKFVKHDEENFALFNYVNEVNHEAEAISANIEKLKRNIEAQREISSKREKQQKETLGSLKEILEEETKEAEKLQDILAECDKEAQICLEFIDTVFHVIGCDNSPLMTLLGEQSVLKPHNFEMYMAIIEKQIKEMMQVIFINDRTMAEKTRRTKMSIAKSEKGKHKINPIENLVPASPCPV